MSQLVQSLTSAPRRAGPPTDNLERLVRQSFEGFAGGEGHPCVGARSVVHRGAYELHLYGRLGSEPSAESLAADLARFGPAAAPGVLTSFVAVFTQPVSTSESEFRDLLWQQLQAVHDVDRREHAWDPRVSADPEDPEFSFSVGGHAYFVIGLHAGASRWARRFAWPALVFNLHQQFVELRESNRYDRMRATIRGRDARLQGAPNPVVNDFGARSEARQYAGDDVADSWRCPLIVNV